MDDMEESLVMRRSRRSTAGNRMEAALAEFKVDDLGQDAEEDVDFVVQVDEQDAFGSDFESTDEEAAQEDVDAAAENMIREEERKTRKTARSQLDRITAAAHARQKATFNPHASVAATPNTPTTKITRRVSLGVVVDAETGTVLESRKRKSLRRHTMLSTSMTEIRAKGEKEKKSALPKRTKTKTRLPTQDELIARALDMEEGNIKEHRNYLQLEEEKRKRARVVRMAVEGPLLRWFSKTESVTTLVQPPRPPQPAPVPTTGPSYNPPYPYPYPSAQPAPGVSPHYPAYVPKPPVSYYPPPPPASASQMTFVYHSFPQAPPATSASPPALRISPPPVEQVEIVAKNYVIHESSQKEGASKPLWKDTMSAMFGDHVRWDELKVYTGKGRPLSRPKDVCPITGQVARYRDPRTGVPFANMQAFQTLTKLLAHEYVWSEGLGCYVAARADGMQGVEKDDKGKKRAK